MHKWIVSLSLCICKNDILKHIDKIKINSFLEMKSSKKEIDSILEKTKQLKRLNVEEFAKLLSVTSSALLKKIYNAASYVKNTVCDKRIVCVCASLHKQSLLKQLSLLWVLHPDSKLIVRKKLTLQGIKEQTEILLRRGHKPILMVAGEMSSTEENTDYYVGAV